jgi:hypothetical protein
MWQEKSGNPGSNTAESIRSNTAESIRQLFSRTGTDVMIFKRFSPKKLATILLKFLQCSFSKNLIITLVYKKTRNFYKNWLKSQKIVIKISTPAGANPTIVSYNSSVAKIYNTR